MHLTILTLGTRGDVQPYIALGQGLQRAGHAVPVATHAPFEANIRHHGLDFCPVRGDPRQTLATAAAQAFFHAGHNPWPTLRRFARLVAPGVHKALADCWQACQGTDAILASVLAFYAAAAIAEKSGRPAVAAYLQPMTATRHFPSYFFPDLPPGVRVGRGAYNRLTYLLEGLLAWHFLRGPINAARHAVLGLPPTPSLGPWRRRWRPREPVLYGYSPAVLAKPPDWDANIEVTGYWVLPRPADWQPPAALVEFLAAGPPPVYVGFGSAHYRQAEALTALVVQALRRAGQRGILLTGWGGLGRAVSEDTFSIEAVPHDWLFPQVAAVVHHGGAGTTATGLRAGVPSILIPATGGQPFWGRRVFTLGVGPKPIPLPQLSGERLAAAIHVAVTDPAMRARAAALGARLRGEDGVARAVEALPRYVP
jgi:sterol 3beta-glucosyltransferase